MRGTKKRSVYLPQDMLAEIEHEMARQERTLSWLIQQAWRIAAPTIRSFPGVADHLPERLS
ncbi:MAG: TIGR04563 family protein [Deltaproteobacteria bacterium]|nr:MAG: TIGR04563 family protein [Deltaproteobacteria bacterium]